MFLQDAWRLSACSIVATARLFFSWTKAHYHVEDWHTVTQDLDGETTGRRGIHTTQIPTQTDLEAAQGGTEA